MEPNDGLPGRLQQLLTDASRGGGQLLALTGAGISAESGIPTFRGAEGYWTVGSREYRAEELATFAAFTAMPEAVWAWYLYRRAVCRAAAPNAAHHALVALERRLGDRFCTITQNVDGLHLRAGNTLARTYQIHGNLDFVRCAADCTPAATPFPAGFDEPWPAGRAVTPREAARLRCPACSAWLRPHVLWFDECYDEPRYRFESSLRAANTAALLLVIGTSGATNLPTQVCQRAAASGASLVVVNRDPSPYTELAEQVPSGFVAYGTAGDWLPGIAAALLAERRP